MKILSPEKLKFLQKNPNFIRNICIIAHVDHGKTTLADMLLSGNGLISSRMAGKLKYLDSRKDEQERGITMKSSSITLIHSKGKQDYLINLIDSPGHVDFGAEVSTALHLCDGAFLLVDVVEGICPQTKIVLREAWTKGIEIILILNKMDRLILELKMNPSDAFVYLQQLLEQINAFMAELFSSRIMKEDQNCQFKTCGSDKYLYWNSVLENVDDSKIYFCPEKGNVIFCSAQDHWAFNIPLFANILSSHLNLSKIELQNSLWSNIYFSTKNKCLKKGTHDSFRKPLFVQFILETLWSAYDALLINRDVQKVERMVAKLNLSVTNREIHHNDPHVATQVVMSKWLPLSACVLDIAIYHLPSPNNISLERAEELISNSATMCNSIDEVKNLQKILMECKSDETAPIIIFVSKMVAVEKHLLLLKNRVLKSEENLKNRNSKKICDKYSESESDDIPTEDKSSSNKILFIALGRVFSGNVEAGKKLYVISPNHESFIKINIDHKLDNSKSLLQLWNVKNLYVWMGQELQEVENVPAGNILGLSGLEGFLIRCGTLSTFPSCSVFNNFMNQTIPILRVAIEPVNPLHLNELTHGLQLLCHADPGVQVIIQNTGEQILLTSGEVHLQRCLDDLEQRFACVKLHVSAPLVPFKETIVYNYSTSILSLQKDVSIHGTTAELETPGGFFKVRIRAFSLCQSICDYLEESYSVIRNLKFYTGNNMQQSTIAKCKETLKMLLHKEDAKWIDIVDCIWSFGPQKAPANILFNGNPTYNKLSIWNEIERSELDSVNFAWSSSFISGFHLATMSGPLCEEPMTGIGFLVENWEVASSVDTDSGFMSGQIISLVKECCRRAFQMYPQRLVTVMYSCNINVTAATLGKLYGVLAKRSGRIVHGDLEEGSQNFNVTAFLPVIESFDFANEIRKQTSGMALPQLFFSHWEIINEDPLWVPLTDEEYEQHGNKVDAENRARKYMNMVRRRKGLPTNEKIVQFAEKQRTLTKMK